MNSKKSSFVCVLLLFPLCFLVFICYNMLVILCTTFFEYVEDINMARNQFGGFGGGFNPQQLMRQAQKMQEQMTKMQEELDAREYEATSGGGMVSCKVSGKREVLSLTINPEAVDPDDVEMLQDMILAAINEALREGEKTREETMGKLAPGGMGGMF